MLWHFFWNDFCDAYLEFKKQDADWSYVYKVYEIGLRLLHPLMPFLTEEFGTDWNCQASLSPWQGTPSLESNVTGVDALMAPALGLIDEIRRHRASNRIDPKQGVEMEIAVTKAFWGSIQEFIAAIEALTRTKLLVEIAQQSEIYILKVKINASQRERLIKENAELEKVIANSKRQLDNADVTAKMPEKVVETLRSKLAGYEAS